MTVYLVRQAHYTEKKRAQTIVIVAADVLQVNLDFLKIELLTAQEKKNIRNLFGGTCSNDVIKMTASLHILLTSDISETKCKFQINNISFIQSQHRPNSDMKI